VDLAGSDAHKRKFAIPRRRIGDRDAAVTLAHRPKALDRRMQEAFPGLWANRKSE
jgi:hypothetical protein